VKPTYVGYSVLIILVCVIVRCIIAFFVSVNKDFSIKERIFIACTWFAKATVQASLSGVFLQAAQKNNLSSDYINYGNIIQSTAILSIIICAPIGAVMMNTVGVAVLEKDNMVD
jgi:hypothetical protein